MRCPKCGYDTKLDVFNKWEIINRTHAVVDIGKKFRVHALLNGKGKWFGYVVEELEIGQEYFKTYEGDAEWAMSVGTVSKTLREARRKLKQRARLEEG